MKVFATILARVALISVCACTTAWSQAVSTAQISGAIRDSSGLAVPGAEVKARQISTGLVRTVITATDGRYVLTNLPVGPYQLEVSKEGFNKYVQSGIVLQVDSNPTIDATLRVGAVSERVEVQADAAMVETHSTGVGQVIDQQRVVDLPLNGRQATQLIFLAGGATSGSASSLNSNRNYPTVLISVAGGMSNGITFLLDGGTYNDPYNNLNLPLPFPDALQEFKVETSALPAQYGMHSAAAVNAVTKSGSNALHGDLFEFLRNGDFNARDTFAPVRDSLKRNQFGGTIGGPILKDKLFYFAGYQGTLQRSDPPQAITNVPTQAMLNGDFTAFAAPPCQASQKTLGAPFGTGGYATNTINPALFSPAAVKLASLLPATANPCGIVQYTQKTDLDEHLMLGRIDYQWSDKHSLFGRYQASHLHQPPSYDGKTVISITQPDVSDLIQSFVLGDTYVLNPSTVSSFRATFNRSSIVKTQVPFFNPTDIGVSNISTSMPTPYTTLAVSGGFSVGAGSALPGVWVTNTFQFAEDMSLVRGAHQIGFGVNYIHPILNTDGFLSANGNYSFSGQISGLGMADLFLGLPATFSQGAPTTAYDREHYFSLYVQDSWKVNARLTVNAGLRWEPYFPMYQKLGQVNHFDPVLFSQNVHSSVYKNAPAGLMFPGDPGYPGNSAGASKLADFAPRVGIVWDPQGNGRTSIRAAYGIFYDFPHLYYYYGASAVAPWGTLVTLTNPPGGLANPYQGYPGGNPFPVVLSPNMQFATSTAYFNVPLNPNPTYVNQWTLNIQRQIGANWLLAANYIGNSTIHLLTGNQQNPAVYIPGASTVANTNQRRVLNQQNPGQGVYYASIAQADQGGTGTYEALLLSIQRRLNRGVTLQGNYTWSHCVSDLVNLELATAGANSSIPGNRRADRGNCPTSDRRHILNLSAVAEVPKFSDRTLRYLASGWKVAGIVNAQSAAYFTVTTGVDNAFSSTAGQRPNLVLANAYASNPGIGGWLNAAAFSSPAAGTYGNLGIDNLRGPGSFQFDISVSRLFQIRENQRVEFRAEAFNVLNRVNLSLPTATMNSGLFGRITSDINGSSAPGQVGDPRIVQLALKYVF